jgi:hypothetical protein
MSYKITIEETTVETKMVRGEHVQIGEEMHEGYCNGKPYLTATYGYAPNREDEVKETKTIYEQVVDKLDITQVIGAVNDGEI